MNDPRDRAATEPSSNQVIYSLLVAAHSVEGKLEEALGTMGLSLAKLNVLSQMVESREPLALSELAARLQCVRSNVTQLVDRLESDGLVRREAHVEDRRSVVAVLTAEGRRRQKLGSDELARLLAEFAKLVSQPDRTVLERALVSLK